jgi:hypothetical protein
MRPIEPETGISAPTAFATVKIGDRVVVEMTDGSRHRFEVCGIERAALVSDSGKRYPRNEMTRLEHLTVDPGQTTRVVPNITAGYAVIMKILGSIDFGR